MLDSIDQSSVDRFFDNDKSLLVVIAKRTPEADGIISLELKPLSGQALPAFSAGSHIDVFISDSIVRQYSICNPPHETHRYVLGILLEPKSRGGSVHIHRAFRAGATIKIGRPRNNFGLIQAARHSILLAGGVGITPLLSMAHCLSADHASFELHYCGRSSERMAFREQLEGSDFSDRVFFHVDEARAEFQLAAGEILRSPAADIHLYVCGPQGFMNYVTQEANRSGWNPTNVHVEHFSKTSEMVMGGDFVVLAARSEKELHVGRSQSIAEVLRDNGVDITLSCGQGICGTCITDVLDGTPDHRDLYLTDEEKAANNKIMICCSRALSKSIVLDI